MRQKSFDENKQKMVNSLALVNFESEIAIFTFRLRTK